MERIKTLLYYASVFVSGAAILIIEIIGTRILAPIYGTTTYVWSGLITTTLLSLALGYLVGGKIADRRNNPTWFYSLFIISGVAIFLFISYRAASLLFTEQFGVLYGPLIASLMLFSIPLFILGMVDPFAIKLNSKKLTKVGTNSGLVLGIATAGGLTGALVSAYLLLPIFSVSTIFKGLAALLVLIGLVGLLITKFGTENNRTIKPNTAAIAILVSITALLLNLSFQSINNRAVAKSDRFAKAEILYEKQNLYSLNRVLAVPNKDGIRCFSADGALQTCIDPNNRDELSYAGKMGLFISQLPSDSRMLLLGLGGGKIIKESGRDDLDTDIIDINPATFYASENYLDVNFSDRTSLNMMDARQYVRNTTNQYDLVLIDVSTTLTPPAHLYTQEFFSQLSKVVKPQGIVVFQLHEDNPYEDKAFGSLVSTIGNSFPNKYASFDGITLLLAMSKSDTNKYIEGVNSKINEVQTKYNTTENFSIFSVLTTSSTQKNLAPITDDHNTVEVLWRDKIPLFKRFNILLEEDLR